MPHAKSKSPYSLPKDVKTRIESDIARKYAVLHERITAEIAPPPGHRWEHRSDELLWFLQDTVQSTRYGASIFLRRDTPDDADENQIHVEIRWFWKAPDYAPSDLKAARRNEYGILWVKKGLPFHGQNQELITDDERFVHADTIDEFIPKTIDIISRRLAQAAG